MDRAPARAYVIAMSEVAFLKMHGLGNDFVVVDARARPFAPKVDQIKAIATRRTGVGCDQLIVIEPPRHASADAFMRILNADGSEVDACGNATRCVARLLMDEKKSARVIIETAAGRLAAEAAANGMIAVDMGPARLDWREIPLAQPLDTLRLDYRAGGLSDPVAVSMGNPHVVFFVPDIASVDVAAIGPVVENDPLFPQRTNVEFVQVLAPDRLRMRVWERGAGITMACGTGACAALVAAARRQLSGRAAELILDGGSLFIEWRPDNHVRMTGPVAVSFAGTFDSARLG